MFVAVGQSPHAARRAENCPTCFNTEFVASPLRIALARTWKRVQDLWGAAKHRVGGLAHLIVIIVFLALMAARLALVYAFDPSLVERTLDRAVASVTYRRPSRRQ